MIKPIAICLVIALVPLIALIAIIIRNSGGPSCSERGGVIGFSHYIMVYQPVPRTMQLTPIYNCKVRDEVESK